MFLVEPFRYLHPSIAAVSFGFGVSLHCAGHPSGLRSLVKFLSMILSALWPLRIRDNAGKQVLPWIAKLKQSGYTFHLVFLWLPSADFAVARVAERVRMGGHDVPEETIRRRYNKGTENFFRLYRPLTDTWRIYDNSVRTGPRILAHGGTRRRETIYDPQHGT